MVAIKVTWGGKKRKRGKAKQKKGKVIITKEQVDKKERDRIRE